MVHNYCTDSFLETRAVFFGIQRRYLCNAPYYFFLTPWPCSLLPWMFLSNNMPCLLSFATLPRQSNTRKHVFKTACYYVNIMMWLFRLGAFPKSKTTQTCTYVWHTQSVMNLLCSEFAIAGNEASYSGHPARSEAQEQIQRHTSM